tara:strand:+ start:413 stop:1738 length:1326 start_codon:yes stop_codon:yes gene_type:complete
MRYLFCFLFFLSRLSAHTQTIKDTIINDRPYVIHEVQPQETLYGIARNYNVELNQIVVQNPFVIQGLIPGNTILIPMMGYVTNRLPPSKLQNKLKPKVVVDSSNVVKMALVLPFYLDMNDTLEAYNLTDQPAEIYKRSQTALDYYSGVKIALDTLSQLGYHVDLRVFDAPNDSVFSYLLDSTFFDDRNLIFGPLYQKQFQKLGNRYSTDENRVLVSPLSFKNVIKYYPNAYQIVPLPKIQINAFVKLLKDKSNKGQIVVLGDDENLLKYTKTQLLQEPIPLKFKSHLFKKGEVPVKEVLYPLLDEKNNTVIVPSNDRSFVSRLMPVLGSMEDTLFTVYGMDSWNRFDNLDMDDLVKLQVHIPSVFNQSGKLFDKFQKHYLKTYLAYPSKYAYAAYQQTLYFIGQQKFGDIYDFQKTNKCLGNVNLQFPILFYQDYNLHIVD